MRVDPERVAGAAMALLGAAAVAGALRLPETAIDEGPGTRFLPVVLGLVLAVLGAAVAVRRGAGAAGGEGEPGRTGRVLATLVAVGGYAAGVERLGFLPVSTVFLAILLVAYGERRWPLVGAVAVGATAVTYLVFGVWLKVPLPPGLLGP